MDNLKLITTENFGNIKCDFYSNLTNDVFLTREQVGQALEYSNPQKAIDNIHSRHKDRLDKFSVTLKLRGTDDKYYDTTLYTQKGVMEICRWSRQKKANAFMDWVWEIVEKYRNKEFISVQDFVQITTTLTSITQTLAALTSTLSVMQQDINNLKHPEPLPKKRYSYWATKMFSKYQLLTDYFHINNKELYKQLFNEMKNTYPDIDLNQYVDDYCYENHLDSCYTLDVIEHTLPLRDIYESLVDDLLERYNLASSIRSAPKTKTIFDKN